MEGQLAESLRAGAIGFSTSRTQHHETSDGRPVASRLASWDEVAALVGVMGRPRHAASSRAPTAACPRPTPRCARHALDRMRALAAETRVPMTFGLVATRASGYLLDFLDEAAAAGGRVIAQTHCRGISVLLSLKTRLPFDLLAGLGGAPGAPGRRAAAPSWATPSGGRPFVDAAVDADYGEWTGVGAQARPPGLRGHPRLPARAAAQPVGGRRGPGSGACTRPRP